MAIINAKEEFVRHTKSKVIECAYIQFIDYEDGEKFFLTTGYTEDEYNQFLSDIDRNYNNGYGGQELDGKKYQLLKDVNGTVLEIENDRGYRARPSLNGYDSGKRIIYFRTIQYIREQKLNQLGI